MKKGSDWIWLIPFLLISWQGRSSAHGIQVNYQTTQAIRIQAAYDTGEPMIDAQVSVYAPNNLQTPWRQGQTDGLGHFSFSPDPTLTGNWEVKVGQAGHGDILVIPIGTEVATQPTKSLLQKLLITGSVIWGCVGTALFFSRRRT
jgi:nickel transport protein